MKRECIVPVLGGLHKPLEGYRYILMKGNKIWCVILVHSQFQGSARSWLLVK